MTPMIMDIKGLMKSHSNILALHNFNYVFTSGVYTCSVLVYQTR